MERREHGQGPRAFPPSFSRSVTSYLNKFYFFLLLGSPRLGRGIDLETLGHKGGLGPFSGSNRGLLTRLQFTKVPTRGQRGTES